MAKAPLSVLRNPEPEQRPLPPPMEVVLWDGEPAERMDQGARVTELPNGAAVVDFSPYLKQAKPKSGKFDANLADSMEEGELNRIASELIQGIKSDNDSRQEWLDQHAEGIKLLGLVVDDARSMTAANAAPIEGMSTTRHPLLLEACLLFQANARGELLPAAGPVKVRDDRPQGAPPVVPPMPAAPAAMPAPVPPAGGAPPVPAPPVPGAGPAPFPPHPAGPAPGAPPAAPFPPSPMMGHNGGPPLQPSTIPGLPMPAPGADEKSDRDVLANALETDFNHYLTTTAQEYYPDTDRMLFSVGFGGQGVKKVYNCPIRRRPVSESIAMEDFIVSNALTDLSNAARITHRIKMRPSVLKRMQLLGVYRDIDLSAPVPSSEPNAVDLAKAEVMGVNPTQPQDPRDAEYELYECYCELELDEFAPAKFKGKGLALPYRVTIEKDSQRILEIRRNWREDDEQCSAQEYFVEFPYDKAFGFYGIGLLHILGNLVKALTAGMRITLDSGMFSNFPGFLFAKGAGRQLTNQFRVGPGQGVGLDVGLQRLQDAVMPLPYKQIDAAWVGYLKQLEDLGRQLGGTANMAVGEGRQDAPVGTTLALIEQSTRPIGAVLKRLHSAQAKEFQLLKDRFRDDPGAFWRFNRRPAVPWQAEQFVRAIEDFDLVPVSDPNNPTKLHRAAKAQVLQQIAMGAPGLLNPQKVFRRVSSELEINDPEDLLAAPMPQQPPPVDPAKMASAQAKIQGDQLRAQTDLATAGLEAQGRAQELASRERIAQIEQDTERMRLASTLAIHSDKAQQALAALHLKLGATEAAQMRDHLHEHGQSALERLHAAAVQGGEPPQPIE